MNVKMSFVAAACIFSALVTFAPSASGQTKWYQCRSWGKIKGVRDAVYVTPFIHTDAAASTINEAYYNYMRATYPDHYVSTLPSWHDFCQTSSGDAGQQAFSLSTEEKQWAASNWEVIHIDWTDTPAEDAATNAKVASATAAVAAATSTASPTASYAVCASDRAGPVIYFSDIFTADLPAPAGKGGNGGQAEVTLGKIRNAYSVFLTKKYSFKDKSNYPVECGGGIGLTGAASLRYAQKYKQGLQDLANQQKHQIVETGWKN